MSFRFFDPAKKRWSIYWAATRQCGELDPPVFGTFSRDTGVFASVPPAELCRGAASGSPPSLNKWAKRRPPAYVSCTAGWLTRNVALVVAKRASVAN
jgi:hypothetical protein